MDTDDIAPPPRLADLVEMLRRQDLSPLSLAELDARVAALEAEIARTRAQRERGAAGRAVGDALFKR